MRNKPVKQAVTTGSSIPPASGAGNAPKVNTYINLLNATQRETLNSILDFYDRHTRGGKLDRDALANAEISHKERAVILILIDHLEMVGTLLARLWELIDLLPENESAPLVDDFLVSVRRMTDLTLCLSDLVREEAER